MKRYNYASINVDAELTAKAKLGIHVDEALREAIILSLTEQATVTMNHNGTQFTIFHDEIISTQKNLGKVRKQ